VEILTDRPEERFREGEVVFREGDPAPMTITMAEPVANGPGWWVRLAEVSDRSAAEGLRGIYLEALVPAGDRPAEGAWWHEVIGTTVLTTNGRELGRVVDVYRAGGAEVFLVEGADGQIDIPAVRAVVSEFDPAERRLVVDAEALGLTERETS
jgi:16S rRNA processing protein RimM